MNTQTLEPLDYLCKFCRRPGVAYYDATCPNMNLESWRLLLACNRCADYHAGFTKHADSIRATCLSHIDTDRLKDNTARQAAHARTRERLTAKTRVFAHHVCRFFGITAQWREDFVDLLMERPDASFHLLADYARRIKVEAQTAGVK